MAVCLGHAEFKTPRIATDPIDGSRRLDIWSGLEWAATRLERLLVSERHFYDFCRLLEGNLGYLRFHWVELDDDTLTVDR